MENRTPTTAVADLLGTAPATSDRERLDQLEQAVPALLAEIARLEYLGTLRASLRIRPDDRKAFGELDALVQREPLVSVYSPAEVDHRDEPDHPLHRVDAPWVSWCYCDWTGGAEDPQAAADAGREHVASAHRDWPGEAVQPVG